MNVIPVIDILNGVVVHAVKGQRKEYRPLQSILTQSTDPVKVAEAFEEIGFRQLYIADLDAIITCSQNFPKLTQIAEITGLDLMVDAGITSIERARNLLSSGVEKLVIGTETLQTKKFVQEAVEQFGGDRVVVSLDLKGEKVMVKMGFDGCLSPMCLLQDFKRMGVGQVIVLDLARVGSGEGVNMEFLKEVKDKVNVTVYVGGGVRDINDLVALRDFGVSGALVATALHNGKITVDELKHEGFL